MNTRKIPTILIDCLDENLEVIRRPIEFKIRDNILHCSDIDAIDYYGEFRGNTQYICPELEKWAADNNRYWEWENCEEISLAS